MEEENFKDDAIYIKINADLKRKFNIKCIEKDITMTEVLEKRIKEFIEE